MAKPRFDEIDFLKAIAIIIVMITHVLSYNLGNQITNIIWNYLHFVVPAFIFCSGFVTYQKYKNTSWTVSSSWQWFTKRIPRLVLPYYLVILLHYTLWYLVPHIFSGNGLTKSIDFVLRSTVFVGVDYGWLPLLFIELMFVTPLYLNAFKKRGTRLLSIGISLASALTLLFIHIPVDFRIVMWLPWSLILLLSFAAAEHKDNRTSLIPTRTAYIVSICFSLTAWLFIDSFLHFHGRQTTLTLHKYPPDIYYLSYGAGLGSILLLIEHILRPRIGVLRNMFRWLSAYSYELFFAHYLVIDALRTVTRNFHISLPVIYQCAIVILVSVELVHLYTNILKELRKRQPAYTGK